MGIYSVIRLYFVLIVFLIFWKKILICKNNKELIVLNYWWVNIFWNLFIKKGFDGKFVLVRLLLVDKVIEFNFYKNCVLIYNY